MLGNNRMEITSTEVISIQRRNDIEKSTWKTHWYFVDFESWIHVEISTSSWCHNLHLDSFSKLMKSRRTFHVEFRHRIDGESTKMCPFGIYFLCDQSKRLNASLSSWKLKKTILTDCITNVYVTGFRAAK